MFDKIFSYQDHWASLWTLLFIAAISFNTKGGCSLHPSSWQEFISFVVTVWLSGKILLGPMLEVRKSVRVSADGKMTRPLWYAIYDIAVMYPMNLITGSVYKFVVVGAVGVAIWLGSLLLPISIQDSLIVPLPFVIVWFFATLARTSGLLIHRPELTTRKWLLFPMFGVAAFVYVGLEGMLRGCGAAPGAIPGMGAIIFGLFTLPVVDFFFAAVGAIVAALIVLVG
ncbi:hypothetical protein IVB25_23410 [Bradyrhizobium sp. 193]|uniref:hypothetical protein n=1 Tax=Bradyrhizobium sp. 193 TaxID=2782661 RepID=UPI001FFB75AF|nr:hypothetical protein [Bradyrhizobium sp. 193]MCK1485557.1 hypothetical protein [Bradyrhizobium sp. 193]